MGQFVVYLVLPGFCYHTVMKDNFMIVVLEDDFFLSFERGTENEACQFCEGGCLFCRFVYRIILLKTNMAKDLYGCNFVSVCNMI